MAEDDEPEEVLIVLFRNLVAEVTLGEEGAGPTTHELKKVERDFWDAGVGFLGVVFIDPEVEGREEGNDDDATENPPWADHSGEIGDRDGWEDKEGDDGGKMLPREDALLAD